MILGMHCCLQIIHSLGCFEAATVKSKLTRLQYDMGGSKSIMQFLVFIILSKKCVFFFVFCKSRGRFWANLWWSCYPVICQRLRPNGHLLAPQCQIKSISLTRWKVFLLENRKYLHRAKSKVFPSHFGRVFDWKSNAMYWMMKPRIYVDTGLKTRDTKRAKKNK